MKSTLPAVMLMAACGNTEVVSLADFSASELFVQITDNRADGAQLYVSLAPAGRLGESCPTVEEELTLVVDDVEVSEFPGVRGGDGSDNSVTGCYPIIFIQDIAPSADQASAALASVEVSDGTTSHSVSVASAFAPRTVQASVEPVAAGGVFQLAWSVATDTLLPDGVLSIQGVPEGSDVGATWPSVAAAGGKAIDVTVPSDAAAGSYRATIENINVASETSGCSAGLTCSAEWVTFLDTGISAPIEVTE